MKEKIDSWLPSVVLLVALATLGSPLWIFLGDSLVSEAQAEEPLPVNSNAKAQLIVPKLGPSFYLITLSDGTRCVMKEGFGISCDWKK